MQPITQFGAPTRAPTDQVPRLTKRAWLYLRVSTDEQTKTDYHRDGLSLLGQREAGDKRAAELDAAISTVFSDPGKSAFVDLHKRTDFLRLLEELKVANSNPATFVDYVIVWSLSRFARDTVDHWQARKVIKEAGARFVSIMEPIAGEDTPAAFLYESSVVSQNQYQSMHSGVLVKGGIYTKARLGGSYGGRRVGYVKAIDQLPDGRHVAIVRWDPERHMFITLAFKLYDSGEYSLSQLSDELYRLGLRSLPDRRKSRDKIGTTALQRILRNPYYAGQLVYKRGTPEEEVFPGRHEALIDQETFDRVQLRLSEKRVAGERPQKRQHFLRGSAFCAHCHKRLIYGVSTSKAGKKYPYFFCAGRINRTDCPQRINIKPELLEAAIDRYYASQPVEMTPARITKSKEAIRALAEVSQEALHQVRDAKAELIIKLELQQDKLLDLRFEEKSISASVFKRRQAKLEQEMHEAKQSLAKTEEKLDFREAELIMALELAEDIASVYLAADKKTKRGYNQAFFTHIWVTAYWDGDHTQPVVEVTGVELTKPYAELLADGLAEQLQASIRVLKAHKRGKRPDRALPASAISNFFKMAERAGFEPAMEFNPHTRLAGECLQPLGHLSLDGGASVELVAERVASAGPRKGGRAVECTGSENRQAGNPRLGSSNLPPSAFILCSIELGDGRYAEHLPCRAQSLDGHIRPNRPSRHGDGGLKAAARTLRHGRQAGGGWAGENRPRSHERGSVPAGIDSSGASSGRLQDKRRRVHRRAGPCEAKVAIGLCVLREVRIEEELAFRTELREVGNLAPPQKPVAVRKRLHAALAFGDQRRDVGDPADQGGRLDAAGRAPPRCRVTGRARSGRSRYRRC